MNLFMPKRKREGGVLPPTGAGLIRYFDEDTRGFKIRPVYVITITVIIIIFEVVLRSVGPDLLGF